MKKITLLLSFIFICQIGFSQVKTWNGVGDGITWEDPNNWNPIGVPTSSDIAIIQNDSVVLNSNQTLRRLEIQSNGILHQLHSNTKKLIIQNSVLEGVKIGDNGVLYISGDTEINNSSRNGVLLEANGHLVVQSTGTLLIDDCQDDGINGITGSSFTNKGTINIENIDDNGMDVKNFDNQGKIIINYSGLKALQVSGAVGSNTGIIEANKEVIIQTSTLFTNGLDAQFVCHSGISIGSNFDNYGLLFCDNATGNSINLNSGKTLNNYKEVHFKFSDTDNIKISGASKIINHPNALFSNILSSTSTLSDVFLVSISDPNSKFINYGFVNLQPYVKREGVKLLSRGAIVNSGDFILGDYYSQGIITESAVLNTAAIENLDTAYFEIGKGSVSNATALSLRNNNSLSNAICADFIIKDSLSLSSTGVNLSSFGFMQVEKVYIHSSSNFQNNGALFLTDLDLLDNIPVDYISDFNNTGLIYRIQEGILNNGKLVNPFFEAFNSSNVEIIGNQIQILDNDLYSNAGTIDINSNSWIAPQNTSGKDSIYFNYKKIGTSCDIRRLIMPFIITSWDCSSAPGTTVTFTANVSNLWLLPDNWSNNQIPRPCDNVIIPAGLSCIFSAEKESNVKSILVEPGAVFEAETSSVLNIDAFYSE